MAPSGPLNKVEAGNLTLMLSQDFSVMTPSPGMIGFFDIYFLSGENVNSNKDGR
jgi:hypothetical protein